ncbi:hypothetical protein [Nocardioides sp. 1609]|uniref:hypothetical protein n=1 Tax=Nocardioides sp. 1609 TaxID=2508327 RepID=UPI001FD6BAB9|nr:hypothetical protein [Nocardioides sp. 1609]
MTAPVMTDVPLTAPAAPGSLGSTPDAAVLGAYLGELEAWVRLRRSELDDLDAAALAAGRGAEVATDMALALSLWKNVSDRYREMWTLWDGGRVLPTDRERIGSLVWGRLGDAGQGMSVPEACRLNDAIAGQLHARLELSAGAGASAVRVKDLRAQLERIRDQVALEPALLRDDAVDRLASLMVRLNDVAERAGRGADVGGLLNPLEQDAALYERDLIVGNQKRREARGLVEQARTRRAALVGREAELTALAATCVATVDPAPRFAVPDVDALGPVPNTADALTPYLDRLDRVGQAMAYAHERYAAALAEHTDLAALLDAYVAKARASAVAGDADLAASERQARDVLARRPAPMAVCRQLVSTYQSWLTALTSGPATGPSLGKDAT